MILLRRRLILRWHRDLYRIEKAGRDFLAAGRAVTAGPPEPYGHLSQPHTLRTRLWRALGMVRKGTIPELLALASAGNERSPQNNARRYFRALERAGYVVRMTTRQPGTAPTSNGFVRWILVKETGPKAPVFSNAKDKERLFDPNTKEVIDL